MKGINENLHALYSSEHIVRVKKSSKTRRAKLCSMHKAYEKYTLYLVGVPGDEIEM
jgi:hypothetical protein